MSPILFQSTRNIHRPKLDLFAHCATTRSCLFPKLTRASHHFHTSRFLEEILVFPGRAPLQVPVLALFKVPVLVPTLATVP